MATNKEIVTQINEAFTKGDIEGFLTHCTDDLVWNMFGNFSAQGKENIRQWMNSPEAKDCDPPVFSVDNLFGEGDKVVCDGDITMKTVDGKEWKGRYCDMYFFENGKVKELRSYAVESQESKEKGSPQTFGSYSINDINQAEEFYGKTLGLNVKAEEYMLRLNLDKGYETMLYLKPDHQPASFTVLNLKVKDIEAKVDELAAKGVKFEQYDGEIATDDKGIHRDEMATIAWFKDPAGNILSIIKE